MEGAHFRQREQHEESHSGHKMKGAFRKCRIGWCGEGSDLGTEESLEFPSWGNRKPLRAKRRVALVVYEDEPLWHAHRFGVAVLKVGRPSERLLPRNR